MLLRHGQSEWNVEPSRSTGWYDADLSEAGEKEARAAGQAMAAIFGRELIKGFELVERGGNRPMFHVPDSLRNAWGLHA